MRLPFLAELEGGVQAVVNISGVATRGQALEIYGSKGTLIYKRESQDLNWVLGTLSGTQKPDRIPSSITIPARLTEDLRTTDEKTALGQFLFANISRRFVQAIRENSQPQPNFWDGLEAQRVLEAVLKSASQERWIYLD